MGQYGKMNFKLACLVAGKPVKMSMISGTETHIHGHGNGKEEEAIIELLGTVVRFN